MPLPSTTYTTIAQLLNDINTRFVPNGMELITGDAGNSQLNGLANFIVKYTLNSGLAGISSSGGVVVLSKPVTVFTVLPTSIQWVDNVQNEYYIVNATGTNIPLTAGFSYIDQYGTSQTIIPLRTSIHIAKATNGSWVQINNLGAGSGGNTIPPQVGHAGQVLTTDGNSPFWGDNILQVTSANFTDATHCPLTNIPVNHFFLFWNDIPRFLYLNSSPAEWQYMNGGGFQILLPGFNAQTTPVNFFLFLKGANS